MASSSHVLNSSLFETSNVENAKKDFHEHKPFPLLRLDSFLNSTFIPKLQSSVENDITFAAKDNDLYRFCQSYGLQDLPPKTALHQLTKALYSDKFRELLFQITGIRVSHKPDLFASCYTDTSYLLCHDDQIEDRRIAFILYLVPEDWNQSDGGGLNIYDSYTPDIPDTDHIDHSANSSAPNTRYQAVFPKTKPIKTLIPQRNSVVIFRVSDRSFHAVDEVLSADKKRIAIGGWWHDEDVVDTQSAQQIQSKVTMKAVPDPVIQWKEALEIDSQIPFISKDKLLAKWLNPIYLKEDSMQKLQEKFMEESHLTLMDFLNEELYYKMIHQMCSIEDDWKLKGPIHRRLYKELTIEKEGTMNGDMSLILEFRNLMESVEWKQFIQNITSLELGQLNLEIRRFEHGHYTIAHDLDRVKDIAGLDVNFQLIEKEDSGWDPYFGGSIHYTMGKQEDSDDDGDEDCSGQDSEQNCNEAEGEREENIGDMTDENEMKCNSPVSDDQNEGKHDLESDEHEEDGVEDDSIIMSVHPFPNTLSLTYRAESGVMSFVKYMNHHAPCAKMDFNQIWKVQEDDEDSDQSVTQEPTGDGKKRKLDETEPSIESPAKKQKI